MTWSINDTPINTIREKGLPLRPEVSRMLEKLIGELAEQALRRAS